MHSNTIDIYPIAHDGERSLLVADQVLFEYQSSGVDTRDDLVEHARRTEGLVRVYAGDILNPLVYAATRLHDVVDRFWNTKSHKCTSDRAEAAWKATNGMLERMELDDKEALYLSAILNDLVRVEQASGAHRVAVASKARAEDGGSGATEYFREIISDSYQGEISAEAWLATEPYLDFAHIHAVSQDINIEAFIVKGCELLDNMRRPSSNRESALLQDVLEAESFYAPILEVLGMDGLASDIRSEAHLVRLKKYEKSLLRSDSDATGERTITGNEAIARAEGVIAGIEEIGTDKIIQHLFGDDRFMAQPVVGEDPGGSVPIRIGDMVVDLHEDKVLFGQYRLKTVGSLARKLYRQEGKMPMDIMGMTVVSDDEERSAEAFAAFLAKRVLLEGGDLVPQAAHRKKSPFYVEGSRKYVALVAAKLREAGLYYENGTDIEQAIDEGRQFEGVTEASDGSKSRFQFKAQKDKDAKTRGHRSIEVSKVTFVAKIDGAEVPTEVQFVTKDERDRMRTGDIAHIIFKYIDQCGGEDMPPAERRKIVRDAKLVLRLVHERRRHMRPDSLGINERSLAGAINMRFALTA